MRGRRRPSNKAIDTGKKTKSSRLANSGLAETSEYFFIEFGNKDQNMTNQVMITLNKSLPSLELLSLKQVRGQINSYGVGNNMLSGCGQVTVCLARRSKTAPVSSLMLSC